MSTNLPPDQPERPADETAETRPMTAGDPLGGAGDQAPPPPPPPPQSGPAPRRFLRSSSDRVLAGVSGGLGRYFAIDPVLVRIAFVVLTFFGGAGALLYLAAVILVPADGAAAGSPAAPGAVAPPAERNRALVIVGIVVLVLVAGPLLLGPALIAGGLLVPLAFLLLLGLLVTWLVTGERPGRDAASLARATLVGLGILLLCGVLAAGGFWAAGLGGGEIVAGIVIAAGVVLVAAAFVRPARWLILPAVAVVVPALFVAAAGIDLDGGSGERTYRPGSPAELEQRYELGAGQLTIDLRDADLPAGDRRLELDVGMGEAVVLVPDDVCVATDAKLGVGGVDVFEQNTGGVDVDFLEQPSARSGATRLLLDADIGLGHLDVRATEPSDEDFRFGDDDDRRGRFFEPGGIGRGRNAGCA